MMRRALVGLSALSVALSAGLAMSVAAAPAFAQESARHPRQIIMPNIPPRHWGYASPVTVSNVGANIAIVNQISTTVIELTLTNPANVPQEAEVLLPVPDGVAVRSLQYDGVGPEPIAVVMKKEEARKIYEDIVRSMKDPALVEFVGSNLIKTSAFPIPAGGSQKVTLTYEQVLTADMNRVDYALPRTEALSIPSGWKITGTVSTQGPISTLYSPSHEIITERISDHEVKFRVTKNDADDRGSFRLSYLGQKPDANEPSFSVFAYPDDSGQGGYFMVLGGLPAERRSDQTSKPREITIVIDRSGSMRNEKIAQAKEAAQQIVAGLKPGEFFNVIDYSDSVSSLAPKPIAADEAAVKRATAYITAIEANGGTNIHDALLEAVRTPASAEHLPIVLFLTDGLATVGERNEVNIRNAVAKANTSSRRIFTFGVGFDVNVPLLSKLAEASRGASTFVLPTEDVEVKVGQVYRRLAGPVLSSPQLVCANPTAGPARVNELMPRAMPDVFEGDQVVVFGRYNGESRVILSLGGEYFGKPGTFQISFDPAEASHRNAFVARLWAERKVSMMVDEIRQAGAEGVSMDDPRTKELVDEIVRLSTRFGILTEYTAFLATEKRELKDNDHNGVIDLAVPAASDNLKRRAVDHRAGGGAVNQQLDMQTRLGSVQTGRNAQYIDESMNTVQIRTVQYVGERTFFFRNNRWVDSLLLSNEGDKPDREVTVGSPEFFELVTTLAQTGRQNLLAFDEETLLLVGKERVLIKR